MPCSTFYEASLPLLKGAREGGRTLQNVPNLEISLGIDRDLFCGNDTLAVAMPCDEELPHSLRVCFLAVSSVILGVVLPHLFVGKKFARFCLV